MSRDYRRMDFRDYRDRERDRDRDRNWGRNDYRFNKNSMSVKRSRSSNRDTDKRRSRSPRKPDKDLLDENILSEISKLPDPSELWDNQIQEGYTAHQPPPPNYGQDGINYAGNYPQQYSGIYDDFPSVQSVPPGPDMSAWNQMSLPPPPVAPSAPVYNVEDQIKKEAAIETEMRHQKAALSKQREDYIKKAGILKKELDTLKDQRNELRGDAKRSPSPDTKRFLKENTKLQLEIQNKLKTINSVVDMLNGIIGEEAMEVLEPEETTERSTKRKSRSPSGNKFNYVYYDPEMHWCRVCNEFPPTAKDYLNHLHSQAHHKMAAAHMEAPWHSINGMNEGFPSHPSAPTKRTPIKGLQFFVPSTAWYCKLCDQFIGDLHCASAHLKSITHSKNYTNFVEQNPHWETDWMSDRQKAFEKSRANVKVKAEDKPQYTAHTITFNKDGFHTKRKDSPSPTSERKKKRDKKKKSKRKRSTSSSSSSSSDSDSEKEERKKKKDKKDKSKYQPDDKVLTDWMSAVQMNKLNDSDRKLLDNIKTRIKLDEIGAGSRHRRDAEPLRPSRERERRDSRSREDRDRRSERRDERSGERRERDAPHTEAKKPDVRKMPFIGKMPVYKNLSKNQKPEEQKKEGQKKKEDNEASKKRQEVMDAEIQKKVAEFKEKIARAQEERQQAELAASLPGLMSLPPLVLPPPALPPPPAALPPAPAPLAAPGTQAPPSNLPKDFQDALDIIFPSDVKKDMTQQDLFSGLNQGMNPTLPPGFPVGLGRVMNPFPSHQMSILGEPPPMLMGFNMNPLFPRPQLYDSHVPIVTNKTRTQSKRYNNDSGNQKPSTKNDDSSEKSAKEKEQQKSKDKEQLDDLALLGIDASDVGAGM